MRKHYSIAIVLLGGALLPLAVEPPHGNPAVEPPRGLESQLSPPPQVIRMLKRSCYDCHSNQTQWPWYSRLQPFSTLMSKDVQQGRAAMNFSQWNNDRKAAGMLLAACAALETRKMPRSPYRLLHPETVPSAEEVRTFCQWSRSQAKLILASGRHE